MPQKTNIMSNFYIEPPAGLLGKIIDRIRREERFLVFRKTVIFSVMVFASLAAFVPALSALLSDFYKSGFINFFSLIFSDFSSVSAYWQSFAMILLETLPAASIALFLAVLLVFLGSVRSLTKNIRIIRGNNLITN